MNLPATERYSDGADTWEIDIPRQLAIHGTGLIVQLNADALYPDKWTGRCLNARPWAEEDFQTRAPRLPQLLRKAIAAYDAVYKRVCLGCRESSSPDF